MAAPVTNLENPPRMNETDENELTLIPDQDCGNGMGITFGRGNIAYVHAAKLGAISEAYVHATSPGLIPEGNLTDQASHPPLIHDLRWDVDMQDSVSRKLVNESRNIFFDLQKFAKECKTSSNKGKELVKFSRQYRSVIKACTISLQQELDSSSNEENRCVFTNQIELLDMIELIWSLCEIIFMEVPTGGVILLRLMDWLKWHFPDGDRFARNVFQEEVADLHPEYWPAVYTFVLQGRVEEVLRLLRVHSDRNSDVFIYINQLLTKMPVFKNHSNMPLPEFEMRWRHWQEECITHVEEGLFAANQQVEKVARLLSGEPEVFLELREYCDPWYHMLFSMLFYQNPTITTMNIQHHAQTCIDVCAGDTSLSPLDHMLLSVLEMDFHPVVADCSRHFKNWWFVSHLTDLLHHCGVELKTEKSGLDLREHLLLDYATSLMSHSSLWQVGIDYFDHCPQFGRHYSELYIERIPIQSEQKALKVIRICQQRNLTDQANSVCKIMSRRSLANHRLGSALSWCIRSKDVSFATYLSQKFLDDYATNGAFQDLDLIDNLGSSMLLSSKLTFLGKYREFHKLYQEGALSEAATLLLSLLTAKLAPRKFWLTLLMDALPLLEAKELVFSSQQTYELLHCLEEITLADKPSKTQEIRQELKSEKIGLLRLALTRNLARATVQEATS